MEPKFPYGLIDVDVNVLFIVRVTSKGLKQSPPAISWRPSVRPSVSLSLCPFVRLSVTPMTLPDLSNALHYTDDWSG